MSHLFSRGTNEGFVKYVQKVRIEHAKELLLSTDMKISSVARQVGFPDAKYFSQIFKRYAGVTPQRFRNPEG